MRGKAFTLIELLIVIAIVGLLMTALLPAITTGPAKARDAARISAVNDLIAALEQYNLDEGGYPSQTSRGNDACINFAYPDLCTGIGAERCDSTPDIRQYVGKLPRLRRASGDLSVALCNEDGPGDTEEVIFYKSGIEDANYFVAVQVELPQNANVNDEIISYGPTGLRAWVAKTEVLDATDRSNLPDDESDCPCFYAVVK